MIATACLIAVVIELALALWLMGECRFLIPYRAILIARYGHILLAIAVVLFANLFGLSYLATRKLFLKDTGRKLAHFRRAWPLPVDSGPIDVGPGFSPVNNPVAQGFSPVADSRNNQ
jgi:hypothetical protein